MDLLFGPVRFEFWSTGDMEEKKKKKPLHSLAGKCYSRSGKIFARTHQVSEGSANHECMLMSSWVNFWVKRGI